MLLWLDTYLYVLLCKSHLWTVLYLFSNIKLWKGYLECNINLQSYLKKRTINENFNNLLCFFFFQFLSNSFLRKWIFLSYTVHNCIIVKNWNLILYLKLSFMMKWGSIYCKFNLNIDLKWYYSIDESSVVGIKDQAVFPEQPHFFSYITSAALFLTLSTCIYFII